MLARLISLDPRRVALWISLVLASPASATFSIVAVDPKTGEVGGAGGSCVQDVTIINDLHPGIGAIHTQAAYLNGNQARARSRMLAGDTPEQIMTYMRRNDARGNPTVRQYGAVTLAGNGASASHTGSNNGYWAGHRTGPTYAIQGNILGGEIIVDKMEQAYLNSEGLPLADRLMAVMLAARRPGADSRCFPLSSQSCFVRVARLEDTTDELYLNIRAQGRRNEPIDNLHNRFRNWKTATAQDVDPYRTKVDVQTHSLLANGKSFTWIAVTPRNNSDRRLPLQRFSVTHTGNGTLAPPRRFHEGRHHDRYLFLLRAPNHESFDEIRIRCDSGQGWVDISPVLIHYRKPAHQ